MKHLLLSILLLAIGPALAQQPLASAAAQPAQAGSLSALDAQNGFRTYVLGTPIKDYPHLKRKGEDRYENPKEPLVVGDIKLVGLQFTSYNGRLASITLGSRGADNIEKLLTLFTSEYGPSTAANGALQSWVGNKVTLYVTRVGGGNDETGIVTFKSNELAAEQKAAGK
jgi:hypothetical protein